MEYYNPAETGIDEFTKRIRIGSKTREFVRTPTGEAIMQRALFDYRTGIEDLQEISLQGWVGSSEEELKQYRKISLNLATPLKVLQWLNGVIADGDNAEVMIKHREAME
jgi:hypothetical protein